MSLKIRQLREVIARAIFPPLGINLSPEFLEPLVDDTREQLLIGGQQAGKSTNDAAKLFLEIEMRREPWRRHKYWIVVTDYRAAHAEIDYLAEWYGALGVRDHFHTPEGGSCSLSILGGQVVIETITARDPEGIAGEPLDGIMAVEAGQMVPIVPIQMQTRVVARHGWIRYSGTLEDDENHSRWAWYGDLAERWLPNPPGSAQRAFSLPTWANPAVAPGGEHDPEIERLRARFDPYTFDRRIAAVPTGVQNAAYPQLSTADAEAEFLRPLPGGLVWVDGVGGIDYGTMHPSVVTAVSVASDGTPQGTAWVRACRWLPGGDGGGDPVWIETARLEFQKAFGAYRWGFDPNERYAAKATGPAGTAVSGSQGSRDARVGFVRARLNARKLFFDRNGEGVPALYAEMRRVHYVTSQAGLWTIWRHDDDRSASLEDAIEVLDVGRRGIGFEHVATAVEETGGKPAFATTTEKTTDGRDLVRAKLPGYDDSLSEQEPERRRSTQVPEQGRRQRR